MCTSGATRMGIDGVDSKVNGSGDSPLRAAHVFRVAAVLLRGLPHGRSRLSLQQGVEGSELKEKVESGNALPARGATRLVSSAPATSQTRARCELVDPRENDDRQSFTQQCPPTLRATGLFPIKGRFLRLLSASEGPLRESGEESSFSNKIQSRLAIDELISPIKVVRRSGGLGSQISATRTSCGSRQPGELFRGSPVDSTRHREDARGSRRRGHAARIDAREGARRYALPLSQVRLDRGLGLSQRRRGRERARRWPTLGRNRGGAPTG
jgi:hypothetical protein